MTVFEVGRRPASTLGVVFRIGVGGILILLGLYLLVGKRLLGGGGGGEPVQEDGDAPSAA